MKISMVLTPLGELYSALWAWMSNKINLFGYSFSFLDVIILFLLLGIFAAIIHDVYE